MLHGNCCAPRVHNETPLRESARLARATAEGLVCPLDPSPFAPGARSPARQAALLRLGLLAAAAASNPQRGRSRQAARALHQDRLHVLHSHQPSEIASVCAVLAQRRARRGEVMVEAGCWNGGASAKFSLVCELYGYRLHIYDSFEGVEPMTAQETQRGYDFSGEYVASEATLRATLQRFGAPDVCSIHKGWFAATLARSPVADVVRVVFIDCDSAKGTQEVLLGVVPSLAGDGVVFSQDFHIAPVRELLLDPGTWQRYGRGVPSIERLRGHLAILRSRRQSRSEEHTSELQSPYDLVC